MTQIPAIPFFVRHSLLSLSFFAWVCVLVLFEDRDHHPRFIDCHLLTASWIQQPTNQKKKKCENCHQLPPPSPVPLRTMFILSSSILQQNPVHHPFGFFCAGGSLHLSKRGDFSFSLWNVRCADTDVGGGGSGALTSQVNSVLAKVLLCTVN